jgi:hypothetical protein
MQLKEGIGERSVASAAVDHETVFQAREVPEVSVSAPILFIDERPELLSQTGHEFGLVLGASFRAVGGFIDLPDDTGGELLHNGGNRVTMKYLATSSKSLIFKLKR